MGEGTVLLYGVVWEPQFVLIASWGTRDHYSTRKREQSDRSDGGCCCNDAKFSRHLVTYVALPTNSGPGLLSAFIADVEAALGSVQ